MPPLPFHLPFTICTPVCGCWGWIGGDSGCQNVLHVEVERLTYFPKSEGERERGGWGEGGGGGGRDRERLIYYFNFHILVTYLISSLILQEYLKEPLSASVHMIHTLCTDQDRRKLCIDTICRYVSN